MDARLQQRIQANQPEWFRWPGVKAVKLFLLNSVTRFGQIWPFGLIFKNKVGQQNVDILGYLFDKSRLTKC